MYDHDIEETSFFKDHTRVGLLVQTAAKDSTSVNQTFVRVSPISNIIACTW